MIRAPTTIATARLGLRAPRPDDAAAMFATYAGDPAATRYMGWPTHASVDTTRGFLAATAVEWARHGCGTYLIELDGRVIGSTGLHLDGIGGATTGYILGSPWWGRGFATEACRAMMALTVELGLVHVEAVCHVGHAASARVLTKAGLRYVGVRPAHLVFPQLGPELRDVLSYAWP